MGEGLIGRLDRHIATVQSGEQLHRVKAWEGKLRRDWASKRSATYKWVRDSFHPRAAFMKLEEGGLTGNLTDMQAEAQRVWTEQIYCSPTRAVVAGNLPRQLSPSSCCRFLRSMPM